MYSKSLGVERLTSTSRDISCVGKPPSNSHCSNIECLSRFGYFITSRDFAIGITTSLLTDLPKQSSFAMTEKGCSLRLKIITVLLRQNSNCQKVFKFLFAILGFFHQHWRPSFNNFEDLFCRSSSSRPP